MPRQGDEEESEVGIDVGTVRSDAGNACDQIKTFTAGKNRSNHTDAATAQNTTIRL